MTAAIALVGTVAFALSMVSALPQLIEMWRRPGNS